MTFGEAIVVMKTGGKVSREGWNGKGMYVYLWEPPGMEPVIVLFNAQGKHQPGWVAAQPDILATDWGIA